MGRGGCDDEKDAAATAPPQTEPYDDSLSKKNRKVFEKSNASVNDGGSAWQA
jgi:hypothetical protein